MTTRLATCSATAAAVAAMLVLSAGVGGCAPGSEVGEDASAAAGSASAPSSGSSGDPSGSGASGAGGGAATGAQGSGGGSGGDGGGAGNAGPCGGNLCQAGQDCVNDTCTFPCNGVTVPGDYATIQSAIDALQKVGATICVQPGSYHEDIYIELGAEELVLRGASADLVSIVGDVLVAGYTAEAPGLVVEGVTIAAGLQTGAAPITKIRASRLENPDGAALMVTNVGRVEVDGCRINAAGAAVEVFTAGMYSPDWVYARIYNSYIRGELVGVSVYSSMQTTHVVLGGNTIVGGQRGIHTQGSGDVQLELWNNIIAEADLGIDLASAAGLTHSNNALFGNLTNYGGAALPGDGYVLADCLLDDGVEPPSLGAGSPCRDAGSPALGAESSHDFHGTARGASPDIGAIESQP
jgi:hypothetical protein